MKRTFVAAGILAALGVAVFAALSPQPPPPAPAPAPAPAQVAAQSPQPQPLSAREARELLASGAVLADVREPDELAATGRLKGALNVPLTGLRQMAAHGSTPAELETAKQRPVILYCRSGRRSGEAGRILLSQGFKRVYNLGGYDDAVKAGLPAA